MKTPSIVVCRIAYFFFYSYVLTSGRRMVLPVLALPVETVAASPDRGVLSVGLEHLALSFNP